MPIDDYLNRIGLGEGCPDAGRTVRDFLAEMEKGLSEEAGSSLLMLPGYISAWGEIVPDEQTAVLDAGGTNLRAASVVFCRDGEARVTGSAESLMPGKDRTITAEEMFLAMAEAVKPFIGPSGRIALCFSYAFRYCPDGDGLLMEVSKENRVEFEPGTSIAGGLISALRKLDVRGPLSVRVVNDTDAVLLSALASGERNCIGFVLGTGVNIAYMERTEEIGKLRGDLPPVMSVNTETAGFSLSDNAVPDLMLDRESELPGQHLFEKKVGGGYLGRLIALTGMLAAEEGLVSPELAENLGNAGRLKLSDVARFLEGEENVIASMCAGAEDADVLRSICTAVERRAGRLAACALAAVMSKMREGGTEGKITVAENGSTFRKNLVIRNACMEQLDALKDRTGSFEFISSENDTLKGAAASVFFG